MHCSLLLLPSIRRGYFVPHGASLGKDPNLIFIECILLLHHKVGKNLIHCKSRTACIKICNTGSESLKENLSKSLTYCFLLNVRGLFLVAQTIKRLPTMQGTLVQSLGPEDLLEKEMTTHSSTLAWKIPWMEEPGRQQSMGSQRVGHD